MATSLGVGEDKLVEQIFNIMTEAGVSIPVRALMCTITDVEKLKELDSSKNTCGVRIFITPLSTKSLTAFSWNKFNFTREQIMNLTRFRNTMKKFEFSIY